MRWHGKTLGVVFLILALLWSGFIFSRSMKSGEESEKESGSVLQYAEAVLGFFGLDAPSEHFIRKAGHFIEYAILGGLSGLALACLGLRLWSPASFLYAVLIALCDEFVVQRLSVGRGPSFRDVLIDSAGALSALLLVFFVIWIKGRKKAQNGEKRNENFYKNP